MTETQNNALNFKQIALDQYGPSFCKNVLLFSITCIPYPKLKVRSQIHPWSK